MLAPGSDIRALAASFFYFPTTRREAANMKGWDASVLCDARVVLQRAWGRKARGFWRGLIVWEGFFGSFVGIPFFILFFGMCQRTTSRAIVKGKIVRA
jgi:hypothetical protein